MLHRAILGSLERFIGILVEQYTGAFPLWLAPVQVSVLPISDKFNAYAGEVVEKLTAAGLRVDVNLRSDKIGAKIRNASLQKIPYMLVVGEKEQRSQMVAVRHRTRGDLGPGTVDAFVEQARAEVAEKRVS
jgi:threonyl-tRNA synthetase